MVDRANLERFGYSEDEIGEQVINALKAGARNQAMPTAVTSAHYQMPGRNLVLRLNCGLQQVIPVALIAELEGATDEQIAAVNVSPLGDTIWWEEPDVAMSIRGLIADLLGFINSAQAGKMAKGKSSPAKAAAARLNGLKGGRPKLRTAGKAN